MCEMWYLGHFRFGVCDEEGHVVDFILNHKVLLFSLEILYKNNKQKKRDIHN